MHLDVDGGADLLTPELGRLQRDLRLGDTRVELGAVRGGIVHEGRGELVQLAWVRVRVRVRGRGRGRVGVRNRVRVRVRARPACLG